MTRSEAGATALLLALAVIWIYGRRARAGRVQRVDGLALLALVGMVRCITDPDPLTYNFVAVVIPLAIYLTRCAFDPRPVVGARLELPRLTLAPATGRT